jgi:hypothetical protein
MRKVWFIPALLVGGVAAYQLSGSADRDPDQQLARRFVDLCEIAGDNIETPEEGVRKLGRYLGRHTDDMLGELGGTIQLIEWIDDDDAHDARAQLARDRIGEPLRACEQTWMEFFEAVDNDPAADALLERGVERLGRTLEIIFGEGKTVDFKHLPIDLMRRFE